MERITHQRKNRNGSMGTCSPASLEQLSGCQIPWKAFSLFRCVHSSKSGSLNCDLWPLVIKTNSLQSHTCWKFQQDVHSLQPALPVPSPYNSGKSDPGHHFKVEECITTPELMWILECLQISWYLDSMLWHFNFSSFISHLWDIWD